MKQELCSFEVKRIGVKYCHDPGFVLTRPRGAGDYVFIRFLDSAELIFQNEVHVAQSGNFVFLSPYLPYTITGHKAGLKNDWIHFNGTGAKKLLQKYKLSLDAIIPTRNTAFAREILEKIETETREINIPYQDNLVEILFEMLCALLSRQVYYEHGIRLSKTKKERLERFREIRMRMIESFKEDWDIGKLADQACVSSSRFSVLYKEFFGISPFSELLNVRIDHAKWMLTNSTSSVSGIAEECGFNNIYYFSRKFTEMVGCPPSKYYVDHISSNSKIK
jgi:AraC family transcriptional regulator of arabinose operon